MARAMMRAMMRVMVTEGPLHSSEGPKTRRLKSHVRILTLVTPKCPCFIPTRIRGLRSASYLLKRRAEEAGELQEVHAAALGCLGRHADVLLSHFQPVHVQPEGLSVLVELRQRLIGLWDEENVSSPTKRPMATTFV